MGFIRVLSQKAKRERRFADLPWAADEHHFLFEGLSNRTLQIPCDTHKVDDSPLYS